MLVIIHFSRRYLVVRSTSCASIYECNKIRSATKRAETRGQEFHTRPKREKLLFFHILKKVSLTIYATCNIIFSTLHPDFVEKSKKSWWELWVRKHRRLREQIGRDVKGWYLIQITSGRDKMLCAALRRDFLVRKYTSCVRVDSVLAEQTRCCVLFQRKSQHEWERVQGNKVFLYFHTAERVAGSNFAHKSPANVCCCTLLGWNRTPSAAIWRERRIFLFALSD